ncbi:AAA family ATPase [Hymenobacter sp. BT175]|uniref:AAA family ATPase n=1 Tax=Hymenobacter translucens TaxID=2886507 RepID=UPI001D0ED83D|nr:AAA family ATPase [Hymenobacter translucens]MCC2545967.1 AAA family ATPase [Hymenobacter translucens]
MPNAHKPTASRYSPRMDPDLITRDHVLKALRQLDRSDAKPAASTVYDLVYRGRRYPPRAVVQLAFRLATGDSGAAWPLPAGAPTNAVLERLDFTVATKRPTLANSPLDGDVAAQHEMQQLYTGRPSEGPGRAAIAQEPGAAYESGGIQPYGMAEALREVFVAEEKLADALTALRRRRNLVLQGPPGTGKTFLARRLAWLLLGATDAARIELVQFHPSYSYEDFVQGFRPDAKGRFLLTPGVLLDVCRRAQADPARPYVLLIDELNRGNLSRIFGELLLLLEADKRGPAHAVRLPYAAATEARFFVPENVYFIGTMNTADRSLAPLDYALRRRFAFVPMQPEFGVLFQALLAGQGVPPPVIERLVGRLTELNQTIADDPDLGPGYRIGHSYFCQPPAGSEDAEHWLRLILEQEIAPLLDEYWLDQPGKAAAQRRRLLS